MKNVVYMFYVAGKPYIGQTTDLNKRWKQHQQHIGNNPMYQVWSNVDFPVILYQYEGKSNNKSYIRSILLQKETEFIIKYDSFLNGWNQQVGNAQPSQTLTKYILDYRMTRDQELLAKIEWKLSNTNLERVGKFYNMLYGGKL